MLRLLLASRRFLVKDDGKVLFGLNDKTAFEPKLTVPSCLSCTELPASGGVVSPAQLGVMLFALGGGFAVLGVALVVRRRLFYRYLRAR